MGTKEVTKPNYILRQLKNHSSWDIIPRQFCSAIKIMCFSYTHRIILHLVPHFYIEFNIKLHYIWCLIFEAISLGFENINRVLTDIDVIPGLLVVTH